MPATQPAEETVVEIDAEPLSEMTLEETTLEESTLEETYEVETVEVPMFEESVESDDSIESAEADAYYYEEELGESPVTSTPLDEQTD
jgi:hypothetical protein